MEDVDSQNALEIAKHADGVKADGFREGAKVFVVLDTFAQEEDEGGDNLLDVLERSSFRTLHVLGDDWERNLTQKSVNIVFNVQIREIDEAL